MTKATKHTYERLIRNILQEISETPKENKEKFLLLKKRANKYLKRLERM